VDGRDFSKQHGKKGGSKKGGINKRYFFFFIFKADSKEIRFLGGKE
jgi:hypothetical protein